jgi:hypothetical protein
MADEAAYCGLVHLHSLHLPPKWTLAECPQVEHTHFLGTNLLTNSGIFNRNGES